MSGQAKGAKHHGGALQADGELVHQTDGKASTSTVEDGLSPQPALVLVMYCVGISKKNRFPGLQVCHGWSMMRGGR